MGYKKLLIAFVFILGLIFFDMWASVFFGGDGQETHCLPFKIFCAS